LKLQRPDDIEKAGELLNGHEAILEEFVPFEKEISVIVARGFAGEETTIFPIAENEHENHILKTTIVPARVSPAVQRQADDIARRIAISLDLIGVLCVEMFVVRKEKLTRWDAASAGPEEELVLVNELAPRPHNSGHWTIEGCTTSQFEQLVRAICGLPLGSTTMPRQQTLQKVVMTNLIGDEINEAQSLLHQPDTHVHIYGKHEARPGRKMGHATHLEYSGV
jgi:5-(carboxyamino)imidazole ribonucleotide synthase